MTSFRQSFFDPSFFDLPSSDFPCLVIVVDHRPTGVVFRVPADRAALRDLLLELQRAGEPETIDLDAVDPEAVDLETVVMAADAEKPWNQDKPWKQDKPGN